MSLLIQEQVVSFFIMFFCGAGIAMLRKLFKSYQSEFNPSGIIAAVQEILFWIISALITSAFLYYASYGAVTLHGVAAFTLGAFLWYNIRKSR